jgi:hypothetical protein
MTILLIGGGKMPNIFKALASITAWILFVSGCLALISRAVVWLTVVGFTGAATSQLVMDFFVVIALFVASVVVMRLRQKME